MNAISLVATYLADPFILVLWVAVMVTFALSSLPQDSRPVQIKVPQLRNTRERRWMLVQQERSQ